MPATNIVARRVAQWLAAVGSHSGISARLPGLRDDDLLAKLLRLVTTAGAEGATLTCIALKNLADSDVTRLALLRAGAITSIARLLQDAAMPPEAKEYAVDAARSIAAFSSISRVEGEEEATFPELLAVLAAHATHDVARADACVAVSILAEQQSIARRLSSVKGLREALERAAQMPTLANEGQGDEVFCERASKFASFALAAMGE